MIEPRKGTEFSDPPSHKTSDLEFLLGEFGVLHTGILRSDGNKRYFVNEIEELIVLREREARIDELRSLATSTGSAKSSETWQDWAFRVSAYLEERLNKLKKGEE